MQAFKLLLIVIGVAATLFAAIFTLNALGLFHINFWGVRYGDANRRVFEQSASYNHGMIRDAENLCLAITEATDPAQKDAIRATLRHRLAAFDGTLPAHVQACVNNSTAN